MRSEKHVTSESGMTLVELLAAIVISGVIAAILLTILWSSALRSNRLIGENAAQRNVVQINHMLTDEFHKASFIQVEASQLNGQAQPTNVQLWLYSGGSYDPGNSTSNEEWLYNTSTVTNASSNATSNVSVNSTQAAIVNAAPFAEIVFSEDQTTNLWTIALYNGSEEDIGNPQTGCPTSPTGPEQWSSSGISNNLDVEFDFPSPQSWTNINCKFVNSFIIRLSETYQSSTGKAATYYLTAGYHDGLLR